MHELTREAQGAQQTFTKRLYSPRRRVNYLATNKTIRRTVGAMSLASEGGYRTGQASWRQQAASEVDTGSSDSAQHDAEEFGQRESAVQTANMDERSALRRLGHLRQAGRRQQYSNRQAFETQIKSINRYFAEQTWAGCTLDVQHKLFGVEPREAE